MSERRRSAIVLAAGQGTRMRSARPKPLHMLCGRPLVRYVLDSLADCDVDRAVLVVGYAADLVIKKLQEDPGAVPVEFVEHRLSGAACTLLTARMLDPTGYGRIVRDKAGRVRRIVEHRDANEAELAIDEINTGIYVFRRGLLAPALRRITPDNSHAELYITRAIEVLADAGHQVVSLVVDDADEIRGVNDRAQLAAAEAELRRRTNERWMRDGVTIVDPAATYIDAGVTLAPDVTLFPGTVLQGTTTVGAGSDIGPHTRLVDTRVGERCEVTESVARHATVGDDATVGPYAVLDASAQVAAGGRTGPFYTSGAA